MKHFKFITLSFLSIFAVSQAMADSIPVTNITNQCVCKEVNINIGQVSCTKGSHPISIQFGTASDPYDDKFVPTNPPTWSTPGTTVSAPITIVDTPAVHGVLLASAGGDNLGYIKLSDLGNPTALKLVMISVDDLEAGTPLNASWITDSCKYVGPALLK